jgi:hypothetical protein
MNEVSRIWIRCLILGATFGLAIALGTIALSPSGEFTEYGMQIESHDWHAYRWIVQEPSVWRIAAFTLAILVALNCAESLFVSALAALALIFFRKTRVWFVRLPFHWLWLVTSIIAFSLGLATTISDGRWPGTL